MSGMAADYHDLHEVEPGLTDGLADLADTYRRNSGVALPWVGADPRPWRGAGRHPARCGDARGPVAAALDVYG